MFGYFLRYFFARASYDLVRANARRRLANAALVQAHQRQRRATAALATAHAPTLDDNLLAIGRQHAALGMKLSEVEACYGAGEELPSNTKGIVLRAYRLNAFCLCVSFWKGRSFQETWTKADPEKKAFESGEILTLLENKTPGHMWAPLKSSSKRLYWWASPLGLVGCFEIRETGQALLHIADPASGAPSAMPVLPAAALPVSVAAPPAQEEEMPRSGRLSWGCFWALTLFVLYSLYRIGGGNNDQRAEPTVRRAIAVDSTPAPPRALPVDVSAPVTALEPNAATPLLPSPSPKKRPLHRH